MHGYPVALSIPSILYFHAVSWGQTSSGMDKYGIGGKYLQEGLYNPQNNLHHI